MDAIQSQIRRTIIEAAFSDDVLMDLLVLKGGNALPLFGITDRASIDLDFSMEGDLEKRDDVGARLRRALESRFAPWGFKVIDFGFGPRPGGQSTAMPRWWGGYRAEFKLIRFEDAARLAHNPALQSARALTNGAGQERIFCIDISKHEFCRNKIEKKLGGLSVFTYSPGMIVQEKLRAICQQMPGYVLNKTRHPRARDFFDIESIVTRLKPELSSAKELEILGKMFEVKEVPIGLLSEISQARDFHETDWERVRQSVTGDLKPFGHYFDFTAALAGRLYKALGEK